MRVLLWILSALFLVGCQGTGISPSIETKGFRGVEDSSVGKPFVQMGHLDNITSMKISPNEKYIVSTSEDDMIKLWDIKKGKEIKSINRNYVWNSSLAFSPNGEYIIFGNNKSLNRWDIKTGKKKKIFDTSNSFDGSIIEFSPNGQYIATDYNRTIRLWNLQENREIKAFKSKGFIQTIDFSFDGKYIVTGDSDGVIRIWDIEKEKEIKVFKGDSSRINSVKFSPNGKYILSGGHDKRVKLWNIETEKVRTFKVDLSARFVDFFNNGKEIIISTFGETKIIDIKSEEEIKVLEERTYDVSLNYIVVGYKNGIKLYKTDNKKEIQNFNWHSVQVHTILKPIKKYIISSEEGGIRFRDKNNGKILKMFEKAYSIALSPNMKHLVYKKNNTIKFLDIDTEVEIESFNEPNRLSGYYNKILFSQNGKYIGYSLGKKIKIWDIKNRVYSIVDSNSVITALAFNPNNKSIAFIEKRHTKGDILRIWDIKNKKEINKFRLNGFQAEALIFSPNGKYIILGDEKDIRILNSINGKEIMILKGHSQAIDSLSFHQNGKYIVSGSYDKTIKLWNIKSGKCIKTFIGHHDIVTSVVFSLNGKHIISGSLDGTIKIWDIKTGRELVSMVSFDDGEWITITPDGYFDASKNGAKHLNILTDPLTVTSVDAYYEKFYRPDIVELAMQGKTVDGLTKISDIKPAPIVEILNSVPTTDKDSIDISVKITPKSGGVGEIRILVNGTAKTLDTRAFRTQGSGSTPFERTYNIKLSHGMNEIKALAFESTNSARSDESVYKIKSTFKTPHKPSIYALVIGIQEYRNSKFNLKYTRDDAKIFRDALETQKKNGLFDEVHVTMLLSKEETSKKNILKALEKFKSIHQNDLFVFYVGSHGTVDDGSYYLITSNVGSTSTRKLKTDALSQKEIQVAISNIQASKKFIVLDTCNSGKLGAGLQQALVAQTRGMSESTAIKILSRAMGSTILSASKSTEEAIEGYKGHGLFTYVLVEGLNGKADVNRDGFVKTLELANYVEDEVPTISEDQFKHEQFPSVNTSGQAFPVSRVE